MKYNIRIYEERGENFKEKKKYKEEKKRVVLMGIDRECDLMVLNKRRND